MIIDKTQREILFEMMQDTGEEAMRFYRGEYIITKKENHTLVTEVDTVINDRICERLQKFFPGVPILSEEQKDSRMRLGNRYVWVLDPLDGTLDFIDKTGEFSIMLGFVKDNEPIFGVVYLPATKELFWSLRGEGAYVRTNKDVEEKIHVSERNISESRLLVSRHHLGSIERMISDAYVKESVAMGSSGIKMIRIAQGKADAYINSSDKSSEWDTCASTIILREAGGKITDMNGNEMRYNQDDTGHRNGYIATNGSSHNDFVEIVGTIKRTL